MPDIYGSPSTRPGGGTQDVMSQESLLESIRRAFGGRRRDQGPGDAGAVGAEYGMHEYEPEYDDPLYDWYRRGGGDYRADMYKVGRDPELEERLARELGWTGEGDLYEFLGELIGSIGAVVPGNDTAAVQMQRLLGQVDWGVQQQVGDR